MSLSEEDIDTLVLATVNAPYARKLEIRALVAAIGNVSLAQRAAGPLSSFFYDVSLGLQKQFAANHGISENVLADTAVHFAKWSGKPWPGAASRGN